MTNNDQQKTTINDQRQTTTYANASEIILMNRPLANDHPMNQSLANDHPDRPTSFK